jgi:hypothetical protein
MQLPFEKAEFLQIFAEYNHAFWPSAIVLWLGTTIVLLVSVCNPRLRARGDLLNALLAVHWIWSGLIYHGLFFAESMQQRTRPSS